jgi:eukaryotic-like serine/threonine-protein kinase
MAIDPGRVKALFLAAIERGGHNDRRAFLDAEVGSDSELRTRLEALLAAYDQPPANLDQPLAANLDPTAARDTDEADDVTGNGSATEPPPRGDGPDLVDTVIADRYKIRQEIGEGGMGTVYFAEQLRPVRRRVALKLIKRGMDSKNVLARFESERQALALMEHPISRGYLTPARPLTAARSSSWTWSRAFRSPSIATLAASTSPPG